MKPKKFLIKIFIMTILITMFWQTDIAKSKVVTDGLLSYWTFNKADIDGQTAKDVWGDRDGTIVGDTTLVTGKNGDALEFDRDGDYIEYDDSGLPEGDAPRTMSVWVKPEGSGVRSALEWGTNATAQRCAILILDAEQIKFCGESADVTSNGSVVNGEWHYVTETYDGTTIKIYIDGVLDIEQAVSIDTVLNVGRIGANVRLGEFFEGAIDEVSIYDRALSADEVAQNFTSKTGPSFGIASVIYPEDEAVDVPRDVVLSWTPGETANTHDVYLGTVFDDVNDADRTNPLGVLASQGQSPVTYEPDNRLDFGQTYYWRIDEVNAPPDSTIFKGYVWSFTVEPFAYPIENVTATASSSSPDQGPENTVNGSGLDNDRHSTGLAEMWLSDTVGPQPTWIQYEFDKVYKLHEMLVWNHNGMMEAMIGVGFKDVSIEYSVNGTDYTTLGTTHEFAQGTSAADYEHNTTVDFGGEPAKFVRLTANSSWVGFLVQYGLSEVRFLYIPVHAREPGPDSSATDVDVDVTLGFRAGREAAKHNVYLSTDEQAVIDGTAPVNTVTENSYSTPLDVDSTYYWRVDEVNDAETPTTWQGDIWNFTTQEYLVVDDFEFYNDLDPGDLESNRIFNTWIDGYGITTNGSLVGYDVPPFAEQFFVHGGEQAMPFFYSNTGGATYSEAERTFVVPQDWTKAGIQTLVLYLRADSLSQALDTTSSFTTDGSADWFSQAAISYHDGDAAQSGDISDNQESLMQTTVSGAGTVSFYWKVSSEADWDFLEFYIDGELQDQTSGEVDWQQMTYAITASGSHTLEWQYTKDGAVSDGDDCGWVDKLEWNGGGQPPLIPGNTGQLYVKVNDVKVDYPGNVADIPWRKWNIDLASLGVDLQDVTTLAIGIEGDDASGTLYFDDFRLESGE